MEWLKYGVDLTESVAAFAAIVCAVVSAVVWESASEIPVPPVQMQIGTSPAPNMATLQAQMNDIIQHTNSAIEAVNEASAKNARGAFWAMATAIPLSIVLVCSLIAKILES